MNLQTNHHEVSNINANCFNMLDEKHLLTASQVGKLIGKHPKWLERKRWQGGGPPFRYIGKSPLYEKDDVINWLEGIPKITNTSQLH